MSQLYEAHNDIVSLLPVKIYRHNLEGNYIYSPLHFHRHSAELLHFILYYRTMHHRRCWLVIQIMTDR